MAKNTASGYAARGVNYAEKGIIQLAIPCSGQASIMTNFVLSKWVLKSRKNYFVFLKHPTLT
jgi:hypothetical protein